MASRITTTVAAIIATYAIGAFALGFFMVAILALAPV